MSDEKKSEVPNDPATRIMVEGFVNTFLMFLTFRMYFTMTQQLEDSVFHKLNQDTIESWSSLQRKIVNEEIKAIMKLSTKERQHAFGGIFDPDNYREGRYAALNVAAGWIAQRLGERPEKPK